MGRSSASSISLALLRLSGFPHVLLSFLIFSCSFSVFFIFLVVYSCFVCCFRFQVRFSELHEIGTTLRMQSRTWTHSRQEPPSSFQDSLLLTGLFTLTQFLAKCGTCSRLLSRGQGFLRRLVCPSQRQIRPSGTSQNLQYSTNSCEILDRLSGRGNSPNPPLAAICRSFVSFG